MEEQDNPWNCLSVGINHVTDAYGEPGNTTWIPEIQRDIGLWQSMTFEAKSYRSKNFRKSNDRVGSGATFFRTFDHFTKRRRPEVAIELETNGREHEDKNPEN